MLLLWGGLAGVDHRTFFNGVEYLAFLLLFGCLLVLSRTVEAPALLEKVHRLRLFNRRPIVRGPRVSLYSGYSGLDDELRHSLPSQVACALLLYLAMECPFTECLKAASGLPTELSIKDALEFLNLLPVLIAQFVFAVLQYFQNIAGMVVLVHRGILFLLIVSNAEIKALA